MRASSKVLKKMLSNVKAAHTRSGRAGAMSTELRLGQWVVKNGDDFVAALLLLESARNDWEKRKPQPSLLAKPQQGPRRFL